MVTLFINFKYKNGDTKKRHKAWAVRPTKTKFFFYCTANDTLPGTARVSLSQIAKHLTKL